MTTTTADIAVPRTRNVEEVLRQGGLSRFHKKAILVTGAAWTIVAMEFLLVGFVAYIFLGPSFDRFGAWSWRYLFLAAAFPAFLAFVVRRTLPESPYFLARQGRSEEAAKVLTEITGKPVAAAEFEAPDEPRSRVRDL